MTPDRHLPPQSIEAEMSILGGAFVENDALDTARAIIKADDFYREAHRIIFRTMAGLADRREPVDLITMTDALRASGALEQVGGAAYLATLVDYVPMAANIGHYCRIVKEKAQERRIIKNAQEAIQAVFDGKGIEEAASILESVAEVGSWPRNSMPPGMGQVIIEAVKRIERRHEAKGKLQGLPYGLDDLDKATSGMHPGELIIIAGRPSMGKSAFAGNVAGNVCKEGKAAMLFTLEMSRDDVIDRLAAGFGVKYQNIRSGQLQEVEWHYLTKTMSTMSKWSLFIDDTPGISLQEIRSKARRQKRERLDLLVIDYLQLMAIPTKESRTQGLGEISRGLKQLARELGIPIIALSQLSRAVDSRTDKRPMMNDLRDSGEIEQDADVILFPYRPAAYCSQCRDRVTNAQHDYRQHQAKAEIIIEKQRAGERNVSIPVAWIGQHQRFEAI